MLSPKTIRSIRRIIPFGLIWLIFSIVYVFIEKGFVGVLDHYPATGNPYSFTRTISIVPLSSFIAGLVIGTIEILYINKWFQRLSFGKKLLYKSGLYLIVILSFLILVAAVASSINLGTGLFSKQVWKVVYIFVFSYGFFSTVLYMASIILVSQFYAEVRENVGHNVMQKFFTGKYNKPVEEERIFMFLDMKSSTTIAESIGHIRYFEMLKEYYAALSESIINYSGVVYQYVGDEIVITWTLRAGLQANNCIECFYDMKRAIQKEAGNFSSKFGLVPEFRAGLHSGKVTTGEIGVLKKEIIFTGDVLNTTARIQSSCKMYNVDILISRDLVDRLSPVSSYRVKSLGVTELRGRDEKVELFTIVSD